MSNILTLQAGIFENCWNCKPRTQCKAFESLRVSLKYCILQFQKPHYLKLVPAATPMYVWYRNDWKLERRMYKAPVYL